jgi:hypothetical protein
MAGEDLTGKQNRLRYLANLLSCQPKFSTLSVWGGSESVHFSALVERRFGPADLKPAPEFLIIAPVHSA